MRSYSDPTASAALGGINREFSRLEKKAKTLCRLLDEGKITIDDFEKAQSQFQGLYKHVLKHALVKSAQDRQQQTVPAEKVGGDYEPK